MLSKASSLQRPPAAVRARVVVGLVLLEAPANGRAQAPFDLSGISGLDGDG